MADGAVGEGAVTVHTGTGEVARTGDEVPMRHAEHGRDPLKDTLCKRRLQAHGFRLSAEGYRAFEMKRGKGSKGISGCSNMPWFAAVHTLISDHIHIRQMIGEQHASIQAKAHCPEFPVIRQLKNSQTRVKNMVHAQPVLPKPVR